MGFINSIFHSRDKPKDSLNGSRYSFFFGGTSSGKPVNETSRGSSKADIKRTGMRSGLSGRTVPRSGPMSPFLP